MNTFCNVQKDKFRNEKYVCLILCYVMQEPCYDYECYVKYAMLNIMLRHDKLCMKERILTI